MTCEYGWYRVEVDGALVGVAVLGVNVDRLGELLWLGSVRNEHAAPGTQVDLVYGHRPGPGTALDADLGLPRLRVTVREAPNHAYGRTGYRDHVAAS